MEAQDPEDRIEILMPKTTSKGSRPDKRAESIYIMNEAVQKMKRQTSNEVAEKLVSHQANFNLKMRNIIISNLRSADLRSHRFFLYLIFFRPENIYELNQSAFHFEVKTPIVSNGQREKFMFFSISKNDKGGIENYCENLRRLKSDLNEIINDTKETEEVGGNVVLAFVGLMALQIQDMERLVSILKEDLVDIFPQFKFSVLINIVEKYQVTFRIKNLHLQRIDFVAKNSLFYKILIKLIKVSLLPGPVFSQQFLSKIDRHFKDYCISLFKETKKWITYKEIHMIINFDKIHSASSTKKFKEDARYLNYQFLVGLKLLKCVLKSYFELHSEIIHEQIFTAIVQGKPLNFEAVQGNIEDRFKNFKRDFNELEKKVKGFEGEKSNFELGSFFDVAQERFKEYEDKKASGNASRAQKPSSGYKDRSDFMTQTIMSINNNAGKLVVSSEGMQPIFNYLNKGITKMVFDYFTAIKKIEPAFLIDDFVKMESHVNPDMPGSMYEAFTSGHIKDTTLESSKQFFDILKSGTAVTRTVHVMNNFEWQIQSGHMLQKYNQILKDQTQRGKAPSIKPNDLFMYNQQLFEHLKLTNLQHSNNYKIEKLFFAKHNMTDKEKKMRAQMHQFEEE
jgi:hypothetical protein